jgi:hypothetical protein
LSALSAIYKPPPLENRLPPFLFLPPTIPLPSSDAGTPPLPHHPHHVYTMTFATQLSLFSLFRNILPVSVSLFFSYIFLRAIYNLFLSPLSAIPGPWYAAVSDLWLTTHVLRLEQCKTIQKLFEIYGPVVRVSPNKVVFHDLSTMRTVYSVHKFDKSAYYKSLLTYVFSASSSFQIYYQLKMTLDSNDNDHAYVLQLMYATHFCSYFI